MCARKQMQIVNKIEFDNKAIVKMRNNEIANARQRCSDCEKFRIQKFCLYLFMRLLGDVPHSSASFFILLFNSFIRLLLFNNFTFCFVVCAHHFGLFYSSTQMRLPWMPSINTAVRYVCYFFFQFFIYVTN